MFHKKNLINKCPYFALIKQDTMHFFTQAHVASASIFERWSANGYTLHLTACASARIWLTQCALLHEIAAFLSSRECITALKYWLHAYGVNFVINCILNNCRTCLFKYLFNFTVGDVYIMLEKNDRILNEPCFSNHTLHTCCSSDH